MRYSLPRGMYDVLPQELMRWDAVEKQICDVFESYGYCRIRTPVVEKANLFIRSVGASTAVVEKEMYVFEDRGGELLALRPEGTAPVVRAYVQHKEYARDVAMKYYYSGTMYRYERPQKGRNREFYQIGVEALGINTPLIDAEIISMGRHALASVGVTQFRIELNSLGCDCCRRGYLEAFLRYLQGVEHQLCGDCRCRMSRNLLRILDCKREGCKDALAGAPVVSDFWCDGCRFHFDRVTRYLDVMGIKYVINERIVRGLDYYVRTAFEFTSTQLGAQGAVLAGGRYDGLVKALGGPDIGGVGFAIGMERLMMLVGQRCPSAKVCEPVFFILLCEEAIDIVLPIVDTLRRGGIKVELGYEIKSLKSQMRRADKLGAHSVVIIGGDELARGKAVIRHMKTGQQQDVAFDKIAYHFVQIGG